jgi:hypothetical protein
MAFVVVYDANALYGSTLRDLLIRIARHRDADPESCEAIGHAGQYRCLAQLRGQPGLADEPGRNFRSRNVR